MYNHFQLAKKYFHYYLTASNGSGHGIHSPFVFDFITNVLNDKKNYECYPKIENQRNVLLQNENKIEVEDFGAGSSIIKSNKRKIKTIAKHSLKPKKFSQLLFRMVQYYQPKTLLEVGTSLGTTASYLSAANSTAKLITCEGSANIANAAQQVFTNLNLKNIELVIGDFAKTLTPTLQKIKQIDFAFVDGNHRKNPTLEYFVELLHYASQKTILVFDDIHWSKEMEQAWAIIKMHPRVTLTIDLFFIGIVVLNQDIKIKQHFLIRY